MIVKMPDCPWLVSTVGQLSGIRFEIDSLKLGYARISAARVRHGLHSSTTIVRSSQIETEGYLRHGEPCQIEIFHLRLN